MPFRLIWRADCTAGLILRVLPKKPRNPRARLWSEGCGHRAVQGALLPQATGNRSTTPHASIRDSNSSIIPRSAECSNALRFGATY
jgi:hypothetical protein